MRAPCGVLWSLPKSGARLLQDFIPCRSTAMTCSGDGTVRIWDMDQITQKTVIKPQLAKPGRMLVTAATYGSMGQTIAAGLMDGSIQLWDVRGRVVCPLVAVCQSRWVHSVRRAAWHYCQVCPSRPGRQVWAVGSDRAGGGPGSPNGRQAGLELRHRHESRHPQCTRFRYGAGC